MKSVSMLILFLCSVIANAQTISWDGGARTHNWGDAANWDTNTLPCSTCDVIINGDSVSIAHGYTIKSLKLGTSSTAILNIPKDYIFIISSSSADGVTLQNGSALHITGTVAVNNSGNKGVHIIDGTAFSYKFGALTIDQSGDEALFLGSSGVFNSQSGQLNITSSGTKGIQNDGTFLNNGSIAISDAGDRGLQNNGTFTNLKGITITNTAARAFLNEGDFDNQGSINILGICSAPFTNRISSSTFTNSGLININQSSSATINLTHLEGSFTNEAAGEIRVIKQTNYSVQISSLFTNYGLLSVDAGTNNAIENYHNSEGFFNYGEIVIKKSMQTGLMNRGSDAVFKNFSGGEIQVDSCTNDGVYNEGRLINEGSIVLGAGHSNFGLTNYPTTDSLLNKGTISLQSGLLRNQGPFINQPSGRINSFDSFLILSKFVNEGTLSNRFALENAMTLNDTLINSGNVSLSAPAQNGIANLITNGTSYIHNQSGGSIVVGTPTYSGITGEFDIKNEGLIRILSSPLDGIKINTEGHTLYNNGIIEISGAQNGIVNPSYPNNQFLNDSGGEINIENCTQNGLNLSGSISNKGIIQVSNAGSRGFYSFADTLMNEGSLITSKTGLAGLSCSGVVNFPMAEIMIDSAGNTGLGAPYLENNGSISVTSSSMNGLNTSHLKNNGAFLISNSTLDGIRLSSGTGIENQLTGELTIENSGENGIYFSGDVLSNSGQINIQNSIENGLLLYDLSSSDSVYNEGTFSINKTGKDGISRFGGSPKIVWNKTGGVIHIDSVFRFAIGNFAMFQNDLCASIRAGGPIGDMVNNGQVISWSAVENNWISFVNNSVFQDLRGIVSSNGDFTNNGILTQPIKGKPSVGIGELNAVSTATPIFTKDYSLRGNSNLTGPVVGTFDYLSEQVILNESGVHLDTVYFQTDIFSGCDITFAIPIWQNVDCQGQYASAVYAKTNGITTADWFDPSNWSTGQVPDGCTDATIELGKSIIPAGTKGRVHKLHIEYNGNNLFEVQTGAVFEAEAME